MLDVVYESMTCPRKAIMLSPVNRKKKKALYEPGAFICFLMWLQDKRNSELSKGFWRVVQYICKHCI